MQVVSGILPGVDIWSIVKIMFMVGMLLYCVFAFVVIRQVGHMTKILEVGFETPLRFLAVVHFIASIALFVFAYLYL